MSQGTSHLGDLIAAIVNDRAVAFVGTGSSASSGVPSWKELLKQCIDRARTHETDPSRLLLAAKAMDSGDYPLAAELLKQRVGPSSLQKYLREIIDPHTAGGPNDVQLSIARIPFSLFLTTNYDFLIEKAYEILKPGRLPPYTWEDKNEILQIVRDRQKAIIKLHGSLDRQQSIVFARSEYSQLTYHEPALANTLRTIFLLRTVLFIGHSLRDADLLHLLETAKSECGASFGPHYAILPEDETDVEYRHFMERQYGIRIITCEVGPTSASHWLIYNQNLVYFLKRLHGQSLDSSPLTSGSWISDPLFCRVSAINAVLKTAVEESGSKRGDVCFISSEMTQRVHRCASYPTDPRLPSDIAPESIMGTTFLGTGIRDDYILIKDAHVKSAAQELESLNCEDTCYEVCDPAIRSELAVPIFSDGRRVGVLNLESSEADWYEVGHVAHARRIARELGWIFYEANHRQDLSDRLDPFISDISRLTKAFSSSPVVKWAKVKFIIYKIDYLKGEFIGASPELRLGYRYLHRFDKPCLPRTVMETRKPIEIEDVKQALLSEPLVIDPRGVEKFSIGGYVNAFPVRVAGSIAAIIVVWGNARRIVLPVASKRIWLIAQLLVNDPSDWSRFSLAWLEHVDCQLERFKDKSLRDPKALLASGSAGEFVELFLQALTREECGLKRVRLWLRNSDESKEFRVVASFGGDRDRYVGVSTDRTDMYTRYTCRRFLTINETIWQNPSMFLAPDKNCVELEKDPEGSWLVSPVVFGRKLVGWISADNHQFDVEQERVVDKKVDDSVARFQALYVDLVAAVLGNVAGPLEEHFREVGWSSKCAGV